MKIEQLNAMLDQDFDDFEKESKRYKSLKAFVDFESSSFEYTEKEMKMTKPKLKKKLRASVYVKNNNNNSLF